MRDMLALLLVPALAAAQTPPAASPESLQAAETALQAFAEALAAVDDPYSGKPEVARMHAGFAAAERAVEALGRTPAGPDAQKLALEFGVFRELRQWDVRLAVPDSAHRRQDADQARKFLEALQADTSLRIRATRGNAFARVLERVAGRVRQSQDAANAEEAAREQAAAARERAGPARPDARQSAALFDGARNHGGDPAPAPRTGAVPAPAAPVERPGVEPRRETSYRAGPSRAEREARRGTVSVAEALLSAGAELPLLPQGARDALRGQVYARASERRDAERRALAVRAVEALAAEPGAAGETGRALMRAHGEAFSWAGMPGTTREQAEGYWRRWQERADEALAAADAPPPGSPRAEHLRALRSDAAAEIMAWVDGGAPLGTSRAPAQLALEGLPPGARLVLAEESRLRGAWTELPDGHRVFESFNGQLRVERRRDGAWESELRTDSQARPQGLWTRSRPADGEWTPWTILREVDGLLEHRDEQDRLLAVELDATRLLEYGATERGMVAPEMARKLCDRMNIRSTGQEPIESLLAGWLRDAFGADVAESLRVTAYPGGTFTARYRMKDGHTRLETASMQDATDPRPERHRQESPERRRALVLNEPVFIGADGRRDGGSPKRWCEYLGADERQDWGERMERRERGIFSADANVTHVTLYLMRRAPGGVWRKLNEKAMGSVVDASDTRGLAGLGRDSYISGVARVVDNVPGLSHAMGALGRAGMVVYAGATSAGGGLVAGLTGNARASLESKIAAFRARRQLDPRVEPRLTADDRRAIHGSLTPEEREELVGRVREQRAAAAAARGLSSQRAPERFQNVINAPVRLEEELEAMDGLGAGTHGRQLLERAGQADGLRSGALYAAGGLMTGGESVAQTIPGMGILAALGRLQRARTALQIVGGYDDIQDSLDKMRIGGQIALGFSRGDGAGVFEAAGQGGAFLLGRFRGATPDAASRARPGATPDAAPDASPRGPAPSPELGADARPAARRYGAAEGGMPPPAPEPGPRDAGFGPAGTHHLDLDRRAVPHRDNVLLGRWDGEPVAVKLNANEDEPRIQRAAGDRLRAPDMSGRVSAPRIIAHGDGASFVDRATADPRKRRRFEKADMEDEQGLVDPGSPEYFREKTYMLMEPLPEGAVSLKDVLAGRAAPPLPLTESDLAALEGDVARLNAEGTFHGDLSNRSNILLAAEGGRLRFHIIDWDSVPAERKGSLPDPEALATLRRELEAAGLVRAEPDRHRPLGPPPGRPATRWDRALNGLRRALGLRPALVTQGDHARALRESPDRRPPMQEIGRRTLAAGDRVGTLRTEPTNEQGGYGDCMLRAMYNHPAAAPIRQVLSYESFLILMEKRNAQNMAKPTSRRLRETGTSFWESGLLWRELGFGSPIIYTPTAPRDIVDALRVQPDGLQAGILWDTADGKPAAHAVLIEGAFEEADGWKFIVRDPHQAHPYLFSWADLQTLGVDVSLVQRRNLTDEQIRATVLGLAAHHGIRVDDPTGRERWPPPPPGLGQRVLAPLRTMLDRLRAAPGGNGRAYAAAAPAPPPAPPRDAQGHAARELRLEPSRRPAMSDIARRFLAGSPRFGVLRDDPTIRQRQQSDCAPRAMYNHPDLAPVREVLDYPTFLRLVERLRDEATGGRRLEPRIADGGMEEPGIAAALRALGYEAGARVPVAGAADINLPLSRGAEGVLATVYWQPRADREELGGHGVVVEGAFMEGNEWRFVVRDPHYPHPFLFSLQDLATLRAHVTRLERRSFGGREMTDEQVRANAVGLARLFRLAASDGPPSPRTARRP